MDEKDLNEISDDLRHASIMLCEPYEDHQRSGRKKVDEIKEKIDKVLKKARKINITKFETEKFVAEIDYMKKAVIIYNKTAEETYQFWIFFKRMIEFDNFWKKIKEEIKD